MWSMWASRVAARIRSASRASRPPYPASINNDCPDGVTMRVDCPPSTSMKKISRFLADAELGTPPASMRSTGTMKVTRGMSRCGSPDNTLPVARTPRGTDLHSGPHWLDFACVLATGCEHLLDRGHGQRPHFLLERLARIGISLRLPCGL